jgi:hypothetical protein
MLLSCNQCFLCSSVESLSLGHAIVTAIHQLLSQIMVHFIHLDWDQDQ